MVSLGLIHILYIALVIMILGLMICNKDIVLPSVIGILSIGFVYTGSIVQAVQIVFTSFIVSGTEFWGIILIISLIVAMSNSLKELGVDVVMLSPLKKVMVNKSVTFILLGITMLLISWVIWPSPAIALVGAIMVPAAIAAGLPAIWAAVSMNLFGHGMGLSSDFFIQGAPTITAKAAGIEDVQVLIASSIPLWAVMGIVTVVVAFFMMLKDTKENKPYVQEVKTETIPVEKSKYCTAIAIITPLVFIVDVVAMVLFDLKGGDATALVGGSVTLLLIFNATLSYGINKAFDNVTDHIRNGFLFGIKIFAPIIVIGAFFFLGGESTAKAILGEDARGLFNDLGLYLSQVAPLSKVSVIIMQAIIAILSGLDGSGFSGLPLMGSLSQTFVQAVDIDKAGVAALGQVIEIWVGGGTIVPWAVIPVAAICNVSPVELVRKNLIPVACGILATVIFAIIIL